MQEQVDRIQDYLRPRVGEVMAAAEGGDSLANAIISLHRMCVTHCDAPTLALLEGAVSDWKRRNGSCASESRRCAFATCSATAATPGGYCSDTCRAAHVSKLASLRAERRALDEWSDRLAGKTTHRFADDSDCIACGAFGPHTEPGKTCPGAPTSAPEEPTP